MKNQKAFDELLVAAKNWRDYLRRPQGKSVTIWTPDLVQVENAIKLAEEKP